MRDCAPDGMGLSEPLARLKETNTAAASAATSPLVHYLTASSNSDKKANPHLCLGMGLTQIWERIWSILGFPLPGASLNYLLPPRQMMPFSWQLKGGQMWPEGNAMVESIPLGTWLLGKEKACKLEGRRAGFATNTKVYHSLVFQGRVRCPRRPTLGLLVGLCKLLKHKAQPRQNKGAGKAGADCYF